MANSNSHFENGTWTLRVTGQQRGVWTAWVMRASVLHPRFERARFVLGDEHIVLISAEQLRAALTEWLDDPKGRNIRPVRIDLERSTVDGYSVEIERVK